MFQKVKQLMSCMGSRTPKAAETAFFRTVLPDAGYELGRGGKRYYGFKSADG